MIEYKIGDCLELMGELDENSIDCIVTDPPYGYSFMGLDWDKALPSEKALSECCRVLMPGAFGFFMCTPRQDLLSRMIIRLEDAGFKTWYTSLWWTYATGFPKAMDISKVVDKMDGKEREILSCELGHDISKGGYGSKKEKTIIKKVGGPVTNEAKTLNGSYAGFQPKPAVEPVIVVMKPLSEKTYVDQALKNGKGITWLGNCKIPYKNDNEWKQHIRKDHGEGSSKDLYQYTDHKKGIPDSDGRFPANVLCCDDILNNGINTKSTGGVPNLEPSKANVYGWSKCDTLHKSGAHYTDSGSFSRYFDLDAWFTQKIKQLPESVQKTFPYLIVPKPSKREKGVNNTHPTVKPLKLMSYLITLGSREHDLILDPYAGSGTVGEAGRLINRNVLLFEKDPKYESIIKERALMNYPELSTFGE